MATNRFMLVCAMASLVAVGCEQKSGKATEEQPASNGTAATSTGTPANAEKPVTTKETPKATFVRVSTDTLFDEYASNKFTADRKYKGKVIEVSGTVMDNDAPTYPDKHRLAIGNPSHGTQVSCDFSKADAAKVLALTGKVVIRGKCVGKDVTVDFEECQIVE